MNAGEVEPSENSRVPECHCHTGRCRRMRSIIDCMTVIQYSRPIARLPCCRHMDCLGSYRVFGVVAGLSSLEKQ